MTREEIREDGRKRGCNRVVDLSPVVDGKLICSEDLPSSLLDRVIRDDNLDADGHLVGAMKEGGETRFYISSAGVSMLNGSANAERKERVNLADLRRKIV
jgi:hypothetical protein